MAGEHRILNVGPGISLNPCFPYDSAPPYRRYGALRGNQRRHQLSDPRIRAPFASFTNEQTLPDPMARVLDECHHRHHIGDAGRNEQTHESGLFHQDDFLFAKSYERYFLR